MVQLSFLEKVLELGLKEGQELDWQWGQEKEKDRGAEARGTVHPWKGGA